MADPRNPEPLHDRPNQAAIVPLLAALRSGRWTRQAAVEAIWHLHQAWQRYPYKDELEAPSLREALAPLMLHDDRTYRDTAVPEADREDVAATLLLLAIVYDAAGVSPTTITAWPDADQTAGYWKAARKYLNAKPRPARPSRPRPQAPAQSSLPLPVADPGDDLPASAPAPPIPVEPAPTSSTYGAKLVGGDDNAVLLLAGAALVVVILRTRRANQR